MPQLHTLSLSRALVPLREEGGTCQTVRGKTPTYKFPRCAHEETTTLRASHVNFRILLF